MPELYRRGNALIGLEFKSIVAKRTSRPRVWPGLGGWRTLVDKLCRLHNSGAGTRVLIRPS